MLQFLAQMIDKGKFYAKFQLLTTPTEKGMIISEETGMYA